jgi:hypothetical protein
MLMPKKVWPLGRLITARLELVVATRLHTQLSSFRLCMSSNTPSCSRESHEWNTLANPKGMHFLFCNTGLRNAWTNRHNSWQYCNLEELVNQANRPSNKLHPRYTTMIVRTQKSRESLPISRLVFFLGKERWRLGKDILRVHEYSRWFIKIANDATKSRKVAPQWGASWWWTDCQWRCTWRIHWMRCEIDFKEIMT